jgi:hypothetical protein
MNGSVLIELWHERIGEVETGLWCHTCALPSVARIHLILGTGMTVLGDSVVSHCQDCGDYVIEDVDE